MFKEILSISLLLFSVIDILGSLPVVVDIKNRVGDLQVVKTTPTAGLLMLLSLVIGNSILHLLGTNVNSFAVAGGIVIFLIGLEIVLSVHLFKQNPDETDTISMVSLAFPLITGAGPPKTILSLKLEFSQWNIAVGIVINLAIVYGVLKSCGCIERRLEHAAYWC